MSLASRLPPSQPPRPSRPSGKPQPSAPRPVERPAPPPHAGPERRRRRRGRLSRVMTGPLPTAVLEARVGGVSRAALHALRAVAPVLCLAALAWAAVDLWARRTPTVAPRHRAEALCFALAAPPPFAPPMTVEPSAAMVRGRFA